MSPIRDVFNGGRWLQRLDNFIAPVVRDAGGDDLLRARLTVGTSLVGSVLLSLVSAPLGLIHGQPEVALVNLASGVLFLATVPVLRTTGSVAMASSFLVGLGWLSMASIFINQHGSDLSALYCLSSIPLAGMLLGGTRVGIAWTFLTCLGVAAISQTPIPNLFLSSATPMADIDVTITRDVITLTVWIGLFAGFYDLLRSRASRDARRSRSRALESEERFERAFVSNPDAIAIWNVADGLIIECNEGFLSTLGLDRDEVVGKLGWFDALGIEAERRERLLNALQTTDRSPEFEIILPRPHPSSAAEYTELLVSATNIEVRRQACVLSTARNITERKQLERRLRQAQKMEAVGQLAGSIAHDFNNMLTVITGYSSQLKREISGEQGEIIGEIHEAAERSVGLTRQLLSFGRQQVVEPSVLELNAVLESVDRMLKRLIGESVTMKMNLSGEALYVRADAGQLEQVVVNLAINARDAMPEGGRLEITTEAIQRATHGGLSDGLEPVGDETSWVALRIADTGQGMDENTLSHATEPFFTTKGAELGTGLGLSTAHGIVGQSGGELILESKPGQGATITILLPQVDPATAIDDGLELADESSSDHVNRRAENASGTRCILVVEDEDMVRRLACQALERAGHRVLSASNGREALEMARGHEGEIDLVVTDVVMPEMSGTALAARLAEEKPSIPILFMSGYPNPRDSQSNELPAGATIIPKPFTPSSLVEQVDEVLKALKG